MTDTSDTCVRWLEDLTDEDVPQVGGKNASLGEMVRALREEGVRVPGGFATTAGAYRLFLKETGLAEEISGQLRTLQDRGVADVGKEIREMILEAELPAPVEEAVRKAYRELSQRYGESDTDVAVRSSATAEDLPEASFAGQQESYLNVVGEDEVLLACLRCYASLFTDRAITYREEKGFDHMEVALSAGIQKMVRSDRGGAGVLFTLDTDTGFPRVVLINAAWGLGESVVQGTVNPDRFLVFKPLLDDENLVPIVEKQKGRKRKKVIYDEDEGGVTTVETGEEEKQAFVLSDQEILRLARWGRAIEEHYQRPMDVEWGKDGDTGELFILQARPETVQARKAAGALKTFSLEEEGEVRVTGAAVGGMIRTGAVSVLSSPEEIDRFKEGSVLVTERTDPDWGPILESAAAVVTDHGGRTSHAAIVSRELGIPAVVGTEDATRILKDGEEVTVSCAEGDEGKVYAGVLEFSEEEVDLSTLPEVRTRLLMNIANPSAAFRWWRLPVKGIGLARIEFIISDMVKAHPLALLHPERVEDPDQREELETLIQGHEDGRDYFVDILGRQVAKVAAAQHPNPVVVRLSDFKTNEYANLLGGAAFEPREENPMLGFRGASRYYSERYREAFMMECESLVRAREVMGLKNVVPMIPFCRSVEEGDRVLEIMARAGLIRGRDGLKIYVMAEVPSNVVMARELAARFDGFSIGSNDLTQLVLGVDRDSEELKELFDENDPAVKRMISTLIERAHQEGTEVGICGQAPSDHPDFAAFLVREGIDSISLNPDSVVRVLERVAKMEDRDE
ncbi:MAG: phosphoenolpyruvate synthase [Longimicrobiales bacterium]